MTTPADHFRDELTDLIEEYLDIFDATREELIEVLEERLEALRKVEGGDG